MGKLGQREKKDIAQNHKARNEQNQLFFLDSLALEPKLLTTIVYGLSMQIF